MRLSVTYSRSNRDKKFKLLIDFAMARNNAEMTTEGLALFKKELKKLVAEADRWVCNGCLEMRETNRRILVVRPANKDYSTVLNIELIDNGAAKNRVSCRRSGSSYEKRWLVNDIATAVEKLKLAGYGNKEIARIVSISPAPRFYISYEEARRYVSRMERGKPIPLKNKLRFEQIKELHRRWKLTGSTRYVPLVGIIDSPAPSFYLSHHHILSIIYKKIAKK